MIINKSNGRKNENHKSDTVINVCFVFYVIFVCIVGIFYLLAFTGSAFSFENSFDSLIEQPLLQLGGELIFYVSQLAYIILIVMLFKLYIRKKLTKRLRLYWYVTILFLVPEMYFAFITIVLLIGGFDLHF